MTSISHETLTQMLDANLGDKKRKKQLIENNSKTVDMRDETLLSYYEKHQENKLMKEMFIQRIGESFTYLVLFPTGLLLTYCTNPLTLQARL